MNKLLTPLQAETAFGLPAERLQEHARRGTIRHVRDGALLLFRIDDLEEFVARRTVEVDAWSKFHPLSSLDLEHTIYVPDFEGTRTRSPGEYILWKKEKIAIVKRIPNQ